MFDLIESYGHEQVVFCSDKEVGLKAIVAIHDTTLGPALGGTRMWQYASDEDAIKDALRLSRGMTYKAAVAGLNLGGGKAVIIGDSRTQKSESLFRAYGRAVEGIGGRYITAEDVGTSVQDMEWIRMETRFVTGVAGAGGSGDPSPVTAYGVYHGLKAAAKFQFGSDSVSGKKVVVQGAGNVASHLAEHLVKEGATVFITDIYEDKARELCARLGATYIKPEDVYSYDCDIFAPNALGAILNDETIPQLKCAVIAGGANNQLADEQKHAQMLKDRNILYAPDYVINAGGLMNVASELEGGERPQVMRRAEGIYDTLLKIFTIARDRDIFTNQASDALAEERLKKIRHIHGNFVGKPNIRGSH
ncbi:MAG: Glu/Leu/Phe/Val dehydrogenase [Bacteroidota bacterium]